MEVLLRSGATPGVETRLLQGLGVLKIRNPELMDSLRAAGTITDFLNVEMERVGDPLQFNKGW